MPGKPRTFAFLALLAVTLVACGGAPTVEDPAETGEGLVVEFLSILQAGDGERLAGFLSPGFVIVRGDGSRLGYDEYLANPATVSAFTVSDVATVQTGDVLVVSWKVSVEETIDGVATPTEPAPRLSTFHWEDGRWRLVSHANFLVQT